MGRITYDLGSTERTLAIVVLPRGPSFRHQGMEDGKNSISLAQTLPWPYCLCILSM